MSSATFLDIEIYSYGETLWLSAMINLSLDLSEEMMFKGSEIFNKIEFEK